MFKFKNIALATLLAVLPFSSHALDARYTDADGDLVADAPTDPKDWIDPDTLVFSGIRNFWLIKCQRCKEENLSQRII